MANANYIAVNCAGTVKNFLAHLLLRVFGFVVSFVGMDEGEENNKQPPKHGFWKSWVISFKKGQFTGDFLLGLLVFVAVLFVGGVKLLMALVSWLSNS